MAAVKVAAVLAGIIFVEALDPERPHLAQAWTALSKGDGLPGQVGLEHYIYEDQGGPDPLALQAHIWDYGAACKKIELNTHVRQPKTSDYRYGTYYINCDAVDCCFSGRGGRPSRPDVKKWDINTPGPAGGIKVNFSGYSDTTELNDNPVKQAEHWHEEDLVPSPTGSFHVKYDHYITRKADDIISHRIDYSAGSSVPPGTILYGNFTVIHNVTAFRETFKIPDMCSPQGDPPGRGHALSCDSERVKVWEQKFFKHSYATSFSESKIVV